MYGLFIHVPEQNFLCAYFLGTKKFLLQISDREDVYPHLFTKPVKNLTVIHTAAWLYLVIVRSLASTMEVPLNEMSQAMRTTMLTAAVAALLLSGCSTTVVFESDIEGATVTTVVGQKYGTTPVSVSFSNDDLDASRQADGCARILGVVYTWPSGATVASPDPIVLCSDASVHRYVMKRPPQAPGLEQDLQFALQLAKKRQAQLQAELEAERLYNDRFMWGPRFWGPPLGMPPPRPHR